MLRSNSLGGDASVGHCPRNHLRDDRSAVRRRSLNMRHRILIAFVLSLVASPLIGQVKPVQVIASIPTEKADISVASGENHSVALTIDDTTYPLDADEALRLSKWIKDGDTDAFTGNDRIEMKRKKDSFVLMAPAGKGAKKFELRKEWAYQLAQALESGRPSSAERSNP